MKMTIVASGTRGDVQPMLALGKALQACGHTVSILASSHFAAWISQHGLTPATATVDIQAVMQSAGGAAWAEQGNNPIKQMRIMQTLINEHGLALMHDAWRACQGAEVLFSSFTSDLYVASIAEKLGALHISTPLQPVLRATRDGAAIPNAPLPNRESLLNYWFGKWLIEPVAWRLQGKLTNRFRQETLHLPPQTARAARQALDRMPVIQGYSQRVAPHAADWPAHIHTAGYWFLDDDVDWQPPPPLADFLAAGEPPIYIGFGSMTGSNPQALTRILIDAVVQSGKRAVLQTGWANLGAEHLPSSILLLDRAPHSRLFPLMQAVVHHGGAGTTAESLRAGKPTIIVPHMADQPFWGRRVAVLGVGPQPIPRHRLTAAALAAALRQATGDGDIRQRATRLGEQLRAEDGIGRAVTLIHAQLAAFDRKQTP